MFVCVNGLLTTIRKQNLVLSTKMCVFKFEPHNIQLTMLQHCVNSFCINACCQQKCLRFVYAVLSTLCKHSIFFIVYTKLTTPKNVDNMLIKVDNTLFTSVYRYSKGKQPFFLYIWLFFVYCTKLKIQTHTIYKK